MLLQMMLLQAASAVDVATASGGDGGGICNLLVIFFVFSCLQKNAEFHDVCLLVCLFACL